MGGQSEIWLALAREAASAAEHIGIGATALGKANHAENAYYSQAFFALSVGFERSTKLALSVASALDGDGFADGRTLKGYGHDLSKLLGVSHPGFHGDSERRTFRPPARRTSANASTEEVPRGVEGARRPPRA